jgi:hypothetical protein
VERIGRGVQLKLECNSLNLTENKEADSLFF